MRFGHVDVFTKVLAQPPPKVTANKFIGTTARNIRNQLSGAQSVSIALPG